MTARFLVTGTFRVRGRGLVVRGRIVEGTIRVHDLLVIPRDDGGTTSVPIQGVEAIDHADRTSETGLLLGSEDVASDQLAGRTLEIASPLEEAK